MDEHEQGLAIWAQAIEVYAQLIENNEDQSE